MPCTKCKEGYKWGETGECKYDTKEACEKANPKHYKEMKNTPTPIGQKTYEEYAKELKEYNLSSQRFDFNDMKTLKSLEAQLEKILSNIATAEDNSKKAVNDYEQENVKHKAQEEALERDFEKVRLEEKLLRDQQQVIEKAEKVYAKQEAAFDKTFAKREKAAQSVFKQTDKYEANYNKGEDISDKLEDAIKEVQKAAKSLGVDIPVGKFESTLKSFQGTPRDALSNVNFDY